MFVFVFFSLQNFLHRLPGLWPGTVWASAQQQHVRGAHRIPEALVGLSRNSMFPGASGTLRLTVLPPRSLSNSDDPGFWVWAGQRTKQKKKEEDPMAPSWVGLPLESVGRWLWVTGLPPDWALLSSRGQSLRGSSETSWEPGVERRWTGGAGPVLGPCRPHCHWPGRSPSGGAALGLVISSPGRGDVLKREPNLGG